MLKAHIDFSTVVLGAALPQLMGILHAHSDVTDQGVGVEELVAVVDRL